MAANPFRRAPSGRLRGADLVRSPLGSPAAPAIANGYFDSIPTPNRVEVSWLEAVVSPPITEIWNGSGDVNGKTPSTGGGTWVVNGSTTNYGSGFASSSGGGSTTTHSATYTNAELAVAVYPGTIGPSGDAPSSLIARATDTSADTCYKVVCSVAGTPRVTLYKVIAGATTELAGVDVDSTGTTVSLRISSSTIQVLLNASVLLATTDAAISGPGYWGFGSSYGESGEDIGNSSVGALTLQAVGVLGTLARVDGTDTLSASATISGASSVDGTLSTTDGADAVSLTGTLAVTSTLSKTDGTDVTGLAGVVASGAVTSTLAVTDGADTLSLAGTLALPGAASEEKPLDGLLSHREFQVFRLLAGGRSVGEIAEQLVLAPNTVSTYRARILEKTGVRNDVELALLAVRQALL
jgi:DNA-binding CsgD family transcriptional regulator